MKGAVLDCSCSSLSGSNLCWNSGVFPEGSSKLIGEYLQLSHLVERNQTEIIFPLFGLIAIFKHFMYAMLMQNTASLEPAIIIDKIYYNNIQQQLLYNNTQL